MKATSDIQEVRQHDLNLLVVLKVLLATSSVSQAAEVLDLSQSAVSKALERLRVEFADPLLVRTSNRMFLTAKAKELLPRLETALDFVGHVFDGAAAFDPSAFDQTVTIGTNEYMQMILGAPLVERLRREAPSVRLNFRPIASNVAGLLAEGGLDLVIGTDTHESRGLRSRVVYEDEFVCVAGLGETEAGRLSLARLVERPQFDVSPSGLGTLPRILEKQLLRNGEKRNVIAMLSSYFALIDVLERMGGVALMPGRVFRSADFSRRLRKIELDFPAPRFEVRMYWHNVTHADPFHAWLREIVSEMADDDAPGTMSA